MSKKKQSIEDEIMNLSDEALSSISFKMPMSINSNLPTKVDPDGFSLTDEPSEYDRRALQKLCWEKFQDSPHLNTSVRGLQGRITGNGFHESSENIEVQDVLDEITYDQRNRLFNFLPKYVGRGAIEGELFLCQTVHDDEFVEVDFVDPSKIGGSGDDGGDDDTGIIFHPTKTQMPLFYNITDEEDNVIEQIPSIFIARYPAMRALVVKHKSFKANKQNRKLSDPKLKKLGGYRKFIVNWDKSFITRRAVGYLKTTIKWLNHYESLKQYEIDHKKSAGAYLWIFSIEDPRKFRQWLALSDEDRKKTGIYAKKEAGGSLVLPAGMKVDVKSPQLPTLNEQDTDILNMIASGLNEPTDVLTGNANGTFASVKATRGPMTDRTSDEIAYFDRFWKFDFWSGVFYLKSKIGTFPELITYQRCVGFKNRKPIFKTHQKHPEHFIDIDYPVSELIDLEGRVKALMGVKHGPVSSSLGLSRKETSRRIGISGYASQRRKYAEEEELYPELPYENGVDAEVLQDTVEGEKPKESKKSESTKSSKTVKNTYKRRRRPIKLNL